MTCNMSIGLLINSNKSESAITVIVCPLKTLWFYHFAYDISHLHEFFKATDNILRGTYHDYLWMNMHTRLTKMNLFLKIINLITLL